MVNKDLGMVTAYAYAVSKGYTGTEEEFAALMADYAAVGQRAEAAATAAAASATAASGSASDSAASATAAEGFAGNASTAAGNASQAAQNASQSASAASGSATSAAGSATAAAGSATTAGNKASEAAQSATEAAASATTAGTAATNAQAAQTAAETAQTAAEDAQAAAEAAAQTLVIDPTLTQPNQAAEAKATGDEISALKSHLEDVDATLITEEASGTIASFTDGADGYPMRSVEVTFEPIQDLHGQDAPYPPGGKGNLADFVSLNDTALTGTMTAKVNTDGSILINGTCGESASFIRGVFHCPDQTATYTWATFNLVTDSTVQFSVRTAKTSGEYPSAGGWATLNVVNKSMTFNIDSGKVAEFWQIQINPGITVNNITVKPMIVAGSTAPTTYYPYSNICPISGRSEVNVWREATYDTSADPALTIQLGQTVYGGTVDAVSGVLTVDRAIVDLGTLSWSLSSEREDRQVYSASLTGSKRITSTSVVPNLVAECYKAVSIGANWKAGDISMQSTNMASISCVVGGSAYSSATAFKTAMSGMHLVYELEEAITITLTGQQLSTVLGINNVWSDADSVSVDYVADTKLYIEQLTEPDADMVADANITSGSYFMVGNALFLATANIANGSAIVLGTNCTKTNLAAALNAINS